MSENKKSVSVIGLGKLGAPTLAAFASQGFESVGVDVNNQYVDSINNYQPPVQEPSLEECLQENKERVSATESYQEAISKTDITFVIVPTPSKSDGKFSNEYVLSAAEEIGKSLAEKDRYHLVVLLSTVMPKTTTNEFIPTLEKESGGKCGEDFGVCYNPEFIALGSVIEDILNPDLVLIGECDKKGGDMLESFYEDLCKNSPTIKRMHTVSAEIAKISLNAFVTMKISFANMLGELCEEIPEANALKITDALGCDQRIGHKYIKPALGFGGPCFPRDSKAFIEIAEGNDISFPLPEAVDKINQRQAPRIISKALEKGPNNASFAVLGLSYKPKTCVIEESQGLKIAQGLSKENSVTVYDPEAMDSAKERLGDDVGYADTGQEACNKVDVIVLATPWQEFQKIDFESIGNSSKSKVIIDCWNMLDPKRFRSHDRIEHFRTGVGELS